jgi:8-hydroxy-5-deazaflavin:NADPH oxidoreductase
VRVGGLEKAASQDGILDLIFAVSQAGLGEFVYRMAPLERL